MTIILQGRKWQDSSNDRHSEVDIVPSLLLGKKNRRILEAVYNILANVEIVFKRTDKKMLEKKSIYTVYLTLMDVCSTLLVIPFK